MTVQRYKKKPQPFGDDDQFTARYEPGRPLDDLIAVARMADPDAVVTELGYESARFAGISGPYLIVLHASVPEEHGPEVDVEVVYPGDYLAYSPRGHFLYDTDAANIGQFYDLAAETQGIAP